MLDEQVANPFGFSQLCSLKKKKNRFDFGRRTTNVICIWRIIELRGRNMYKILTQCRPNTFNLKSKKMNKLCAPVLLSQVSCLSYLP